MLYFCSDGNHINQVNGRPTIFRKKMVRTNDFLFNSKQGFLQNFSKTKKVMKMRSKATLFPKAGYSCSSPINHLLLNPTTGHHYQKRKCLYKKRFIFQWLSSYEFYFAAHITSYLLLLTIWLLETKWGEIRIMKWQTSSITPRAFRLVPVTRFCALFRFINQCLQQNLAQEKKSEDNHILPFYSNGDKKGSTISLVKNATENNVQITLLFLPASQCGNYRNFLSIRFYVKSKLQNLGFQKLPFYHIQRL